VTACLSKPPTKPISQSWTAVRVYCLWGQSNKSARMNRNPKVPVSPESSVPGFADRSALYKLTRLAHCNPVNLLRRAPAQPIMQLRELTQEPDLCQP
jgi:hypothetical protein